MWTSRSRGRSAASPSRKTRRRRSLFTVAVRSPHPQVHLVLADSDMTSSFPYMYGQAHYIALMTHKTPRILHREPLNIVAPCLMQRRARSGAWGSFQLLAVQSSRAWAARRWSKLIEPQQTLAGPRLRRRVGCCLRRRQPSPCLRAVTFLQQRHSLRMRRHRCRHLWCPAPWQPRVAREGLASTNASQCKDPRRRPRCSDRVLRKRPMAGSAAASCRC